MAVPAGSREVTVAFSFISEHACIWFKEIYEELELGFKCGSDPSIKPYFIT
jgi:hypothetical protein